MEVNAFSHQQEELAELSILMQAQLLPEQILVFQRLIQAIEADNNQQISRCFFLNGKAGLGKTFTVNTIVNYLRGQEHVVIITGLTALSVTLYECGKTAHSTFGIPIVEV